jgi:8-oxo-dGTP diphosphatase
MDGVAETAGAAARPAVAVAVVTSGLGVLVGRRRDGNPPWTFPGGKIEPGESPEDTAVRETLEETGLDVIPVRVLGQREHPATGTLISYVACMADGIARVASLRELAEVRWVPPGEADELTGGTIYGPVSAYLRETLET